MRLSFPVLCVAILLAAATGPVHAQRVEVETFTLDNGMKFLLVPRHDTPNSIAAGWMAKVGSVNERPGITGISHFFEHMMFKGTNTIGTKDAKKDADYRAKQKALRDQINALVWNQQYARFKAGEINDPWDPTNDTAELKKLRAELKASMDAQQGNGKAEEIKVKQAELDKVKKTLPDDQTKIDAIKLEIEQLQKQQKEMGSIEKNEFDSVYTKQGGSGMNAFTANDLTFYFINIPSNKFELWAWMESDRLSDSVFREFYSERDVVHEERRLRTESTPTGVFEEQFDAMFWQSSPYSWPVIGWTSDLNSYTMEQAQDYFNIYYRPNNIVGVIVGDFDPAAIKPVIKEYFSRLKRGEIAPPPVVTLEMPQTVEKRMYAECDCQPQIEIRYHAVPFNHRDSFALEIMSNVLNGRTGRLYKSMVEGKGIASSASARPSGFGGPSKYAGYFAFDAEVKGDATPEDLEKAWYEELEKLQKEPVSEHELQKVKNQSAANAYRRLQNNFFLLVQIGYYEGLGGWEYLNESPAKLQAVTAEDIQRVAKRYFDRTNRNVAIYTRKAQNESAAATNEDPELAALDEQTRGKIKQMLAGLKNVRDPGELQMVIGAMEAQMGQTPPDKKPAMEYILKKIREHLAELEGETKE